MRVVESIASLREARGALKGTVGLVPTMGALHTGHLGLLQPAKRENDHVIATIFVNPTQFGPNEDFDSYPRTLERDLVELEKAGVDVVFTPTPELMYPPGYQTYVTVDKVSLPLEGAGRPGHFRGVTTIVSKLFNLTQPTRAYFGQKDAQQVVVIRRMVHDLNFPLRVRVVPTARDDDGLALSSRNVYLDEAQREAADVLFRALSAASQAYNSGERGADALRAAMRNVVQAEPLAEALYISAADVQTLDELEGVMDDPVLLSLAVRFGTTRLLDNRLLPDHLNDTEGLSATLGVYM